MEQTGNDGIAAFFPTSGDYTVRATWEGVTSDLGKFTQTAGSPAKIQLVIESCPLVKVGGTIRQADRNPVPTGRAVLKYDPGDAEKMPEEARRLLDGEASAQVFADKDGKYEFKRLLYPGTYWLWAAAPEHAASSAPKTFVVPENAPYTSVELDLVVEALDSVTLMGRVLGPGGIPVSGVKVVVREFITNEGGRAVGYTESVRETDESGIYRARSSTDKIQIVTCHPSLRPASLSLDMNVELESGKVKTVEDIQLHAKTTHVTADLRMEGTGDAVEAGIRLQEISSDEKKTAVSFGHTSYTVSSDVRGTAHFQVDALSRYMIDVVGYTVGRIESDVTTERPRKVFRFQPDGGRITIFVRKP